MIYEVVHRLALSAAFRAPGAAFRAPGAAFRALRAWGGVVVGLHKTKGLNRERGGVHREGTQQGVASMSTQEGLKPCRQTSRASLRNPCFALDDVIKNHSH